MADAKPFRDKPADPAAVPAAVEMRKKSRFGTIGIVVAVMVIEGMAIFAVMRMFGVDAEHVSAETIDPASKPAADDVEIQLVQLRALNGKTGRPVFYSIKVFVRVRADKADEFKRLIEKKKAVIEDAVARIVRSAEPSHLAKDGLETLRRQLQFELGRITNDESLIEEILIPECTPFPTGF